MNMQEVLLVRRKTIVGHLTQETLDGAMREDRVVSEHSLGSLLLDTSNGGGFLSQHLVQVFHNLQLMPPLILLPGELSPPLWSPLD